MLLISAVRAAFSFISRCVSLLGALAAFRSSVVIEAVPLEADDNRVVICAPIDLLSKFALVTCPLLANVTCHLRFSKIFAVSGKVCGRPNCAKTVGLSGSGRRDRSSLLAGAS